MSEKRIARKYDLTQETIDQLNKLDEIIKGKTMRDIVAEAISILAEEHGVGERLENSDSLDKLNKKLHHQDEVIKIICTAYLKDMEVKKADKRKASKMVANAIGNTARNPQALWDALEDDLPESLQRQEYFRMLLEINGIPRKKAAKVRKK